MQTIIERIIREDILNELLKHKKDYNISKVYLDNELEKIINIYLRTNEESYGIKTYHYQNIMAYSIIDIFIKIKQNSRECN